MTRPPARMVFIALHRYLRLAAAAAVLLVVGSSLRPALSTGGNLDGSVVSAVVVDGRTHLPIEGAEVFSLPSGPNGRSGPGGRILLAIPAGSSVDLVCARDATKSVACRGINDTAERSDLWLVLHNQARVRGVVRTPTGDAGQGLLIKSHIKHATADAASPGSRSYEVDTGRETVTGEGGSYELRELPPGRIRLHVGDGPSGEGAAEFDVAEGDHAYEMGMVISSSTAVLEGSLRDAKTGDPLEGVAVEAGRDKTVSDSDGGFRLEGLPKGLVRFRTYGGDTRPSSWAIVVRQDEGELEIHVPVERSVHRPARVGIVTDAKGRPLEGAAVQWSTAYTCDISRCAPRGRSSETTLSALTNRDGSFTLDGGGYDSVAVGGYAYLCVIPPEESHAPVQVQVGESVAFVRVRLPTWRSIRGEVREQGSRRPVGRFSVLALEEIVATDADGQARIPLRNWAPLCSDSAGGIKVQSERGTFSVASTGRGDVYVRVMADGYIPSKAVLVRSAGDEHSSKTKIAFELEPLDTEGVVTGRVILPPGSGAGGVTNTFVCAVPVLPRLDAQEPDPTLSGAWDAYCRGRIVADGSFRVEGLPLGEVEMRVQGWSEVSRWVARVEGDAEPVELRPRTRLAEAAGFGWLGHVRVKEHAGRLYAVQVDAGSPPAAAGLEPGDEILSIDGKPALQRWEDFRRDLGLHRPIPRSVSLSVRSLRGELPRPVWIIGQE